jgi:hypothetical protein
LDVISEAYLGPMDAREQAKFGKKNLKQNKENNTEWSYILDFE